MTGEETDVSIVVDRRRSANEERCSLIRSLTMEMEDLRSLVSVFLEEVESRLSRRVSFSFGGEDIAFWCSITRGESVRLSGL